MGLDNFKKIQSNFNGQTPSTGKEVEDAFNENFEAVKDEIVQLAGDSIMEYGENIFLSKYFRNVTGDLVMGGISLTTRKITSSSLVNRTGFIACKPGDKFIYSGIVSSNIPVGGWVNPNVDEECVMLLNNTDGESIGTGVFKFENYISVVPPGINYIVACSRTENHPDTPANLLLLLKDGQNIRLITEDDEVVTQEKTLPVMQLHKDLYVGNSWDKQDVTGNLVLGGISITSKKIYDSQEVNRTDFIPCKEGDIFLYSGIVWTSIPVGGWVNPNVDEECVMLLNNTDGELIDPGAHREVYRFENFVFRIPPGINYIVACSRTENHPDTPAKLTLLKNEVIRIITEKDDIASSGVIISTQPDISPVYSQERNTFNLCAIKKTIEDSRVPCNLGYLFHEYPAKNGNLYYSNTLDRPEFLGEVGSGAFDVSLTMIAFAPSGKVILTRRHQPGNLYVFDTQTLQTTTVNFTGIDGFPRNPIGWLYNSGVDFIKDGEGNEICVFNEYSHGGRTPLYVWRGKYPYTSTDDWEIVLQEDADLQGGIHHWHQVRRDPWTNIVYCIAGDYPGECKWYYSLDYGKTWILLTTGELWEENTARTINLLFSEDYIYWATDHSTNHSLNRVKRAINGVIDISTREKITDLSPTQATNFIALVENPKGIFIYDRKGTADIGRTEGVWVYFWDFDKKRLVYLHFYRHFQGVDTWWGHRGKCYIEYTNSMENRLAMGVSEDSPIWFDIVGNTGNSIGTVMYLLQ